MAAPASASGMAVVMTLLVTVAWVVFTVRTAGKWADARAMRKGAKRTLRVLAALAGLLGGFCIGGVAFLPAAAGDGSVMFVGAVFLAPFGAMWLHLQRQKKQPPAPLIQAPPPVIDDAPLPPPVPAPAPTPAPVQDDALARTPWVCFVGFDACELALLTRLARSNGWEVIEAMRHMPRPGDCLVLPEGDTEHHAQRMSAEALGITVMGVSNFRARASTWHHWVKQLRSNHGPEPFAAPLPPQPAPEPEPPPPPKRRADPPPVPPRTPPRAAPAASDRITLPHTFQFQYRTSDGGNYARRTVTVQHISSRGNHTYLEGYDTDRRETRTFRTNRIRGGLTDMETGELIPTQRLLDQVRERQAMTYRPSPAPKSRDDGSWQTAVLFTGFSAARREKLEAIAEVAGWHVRVAIGPTLDYLVAGPRAGRTKLAKAEEFGVSVIDEDYFRLLAE